MINIDEVRSNLPVTKKYVYLDHAAVGPLPECVVDAVKTCTVEKFYGDVFWENWEKTAETTRQAIAGLLNANKEEIALIPNTSEGLGIIGNGLKYLPGENIVTSNLEFTSNLFVWQALCKRYDMEFRAVKAKKEVLELDDFEKMINKKTRLVAVSHVQFSNGFKIDLNKLSDIAHENGAYVITDAVQSVGQMPIDVKQLEVDFLACSGYKWLLSPLATGFLYIKKNLIETVYPSIIGYRSSEYPDNFKFRTFDPVKNARRFEHGQLNFPGFAGMLEAIRFLTSYGIQHIQRRIQKLMDQLIEGVSWMPHFTHLSSISPQHRSGIIKLSCRDPNAVTTKLLSKKIITSVRAGGLRVSPHFYNSEEEIDYLLKNLKKYH